MKIAIVGGGAAGMMAAATLLENNTNLEIHLFEKNSTLGKKVSISGGGRCNVTTGIFDKKVLLSKYIRGSNFFKSALYNFPPEEVIKWFKKKGLSLKVEEDLRVFPQSDAGEDVVKLFNRLFSNKVNLHLVTKVISIEKREKQFELKTQSVKYLFDIIIITSGGNAYKHTGSSGDGYDFAKALGHSTTQLGPSLNSFETKENWCKELTGISLNNAKIIFNNQNKTSIVGSLLFTHFGVSGPLVFALSSHLAFEEISKENPKIINLCPDSNSNYSFWENYFLEQFSKNGKKQIKNLDFLNFPKRFILKLLENLSIDESKKAAEVSKEERKKLSTVFSEGIPLTLILRRPGDEFVTAGGIKSEEINSKTMESKLIKDLYFAGEILNIDGLTGGFNLQSAWATGRLAAENILKRLI